MLQMKTTTLKILPRFPTISEIFFVKDDEIIVSFDVTSLYTNIPIIDTLNINKDQFTRKTAIPQDKFLDPINLVLTATWYTFHCQFCHRTDTVVMGGSTY